MITRAPAFLSTPIPTQHSSSVHLLNLSCSATSPGISAASIHPRTSYPLPSTDLQRILSTPLSTPPNPAGRPSRILYLFRNDLRTVDNAALHTAVDWANAVPTGALIPMYFNADRKSGDAVTELKANLRSCGSDLLMPVSMNITETVLELCKRLKLSAVVFNRSGDVRNAREEERLIAGLQHADVQVHAFWGGMLNPPKEGMLNGKKMPTKKDVMMALPKEMSKVVKDMDQMPKVPSAAYSVVSLRQIEGRVGKGTTLGLRILSGMRKETELLRIEKKTDLALEIKKLLDVGAVSPRMIASRIVQVVGKATGRTFSELVWRDYTAVMVSRSVGVKSVKQAVTA